MKAKVKKSIKVDFRERCSSYKSPFDGEAMDTTLNPNIEMLNLRGKYIEVKRFEKDGNWFLQKSQLLLASNLYWHKNWLELGDQLELEF